MRQHSEAHPSPASVEQRFLDVWRDMRRCASMQAARREILGAGESALELGQFDALDCLIDSGGMRMHVLAEAMRIDASTATRAVSRLVQVGLAEKVRDDGDGRGIVVVATARGRRRHATARERALSFVRSALRSFDRDEREALASLMERYVQGLDRLLESREPGA